MGNRSRSDTARGGEPDRGLLRILTCGSVGDGKSTLIGRLLDDAELLLDGPGAELSVDGAYRHFASRRRSFIVADTPGHEQNTRDMAAAASTSRLAVVVVDARKGVAPQTRHDSAMCSLFGIRAVVLAVNKMDLVGYSQSTFDSIVSEYREFASKLSFASVTPIPVSARLGDNVTERSRNMPWYQGPSLLEHLEGVSVEDDSGARPFRLPVQSINRPNPDFLGPDFLGIVGTVAVGRIGKGGAVVVAGSGAKGTVSRIVTADGDRDEARTGDAVTLVLAEQIDVAPGDLLADPAARPDVADQLAAHIVWMGNEPLLPGRSYLMRIGTRWLPASVSKIAHKLDVHHFEKLAARTLSLNDIGFCNLSFAAPVAFDPYEKSRETGAFILVDRTSNETVAAGMIAFALRRATNIHVERLGVDKPMRATLKQQRPCIVWFTGLPAAGKSTIARLVEVTLHAAGHHTYMLDGDNLRHGLNRDIGFTDADRVENIRRVGEVAKLFVDAGLIVLCAFISPFRAERQMVRDLVAAGEFIEVFVDTSIEECMRRDPKGLYAKARAGQIKNFTGFDSVYEPPTAPDLLLRTTEEAAEALAARVIDHLRASGHLVAHEVGAGR